MMKGIRHRAWAAAVVASLCFVGCQDGDGDEPKPNEYVPTTVTPKQVRIPDGEAILSGEVKVVELELDAPQRYMTCLEFFEPTGSVVAEWPFESKERADRVLWGCDAEAHVRTEQAEYVAYPLPIDPATTTRDLKLVKYAGGKHAWSHIIDRSEQGRNFVANFRHSFITRLDSMTCAGTLWEGGTQTHCIDDETGEPIWKGWMPFWAGMAPQSGDGGLWVADLTAVTKRYPFTGVEMAYTKLPETGGRAALYGTDGDSLFFSPSRATPPTLSAIEFESGQTRWMLELQTKPISSFSEVFPEHKLLVVLIDQEIVGFDTESGELLWHWEIGDDRPSVAMWGSQLIVLHRRPDLPNAAISLNPRTGARAWRAELPTGVLEVRASGSHLLFKSIRAIQRVTGGIEHTP